MHLCQSYPEEQLVFAAGIKMKESGNTDGAKLIKEITKTPTAATEIIKACQEKESRKTIVKYTPEEALGFMIDTNQLHIIKSCDKVQKNETLIFTHRTKNFLRQNKIVIHPKAILSLQSLLPRLNCKHFLTLLVIGLWSRK